MKNKIWKPLLLKNGKYIIDEDTDELHSYIGNETIFNTLLDILYPEEKEENENLF